MSSHPLTSQDPSILTQANAGLSNSVTQGVVHQDVVLYDGECNFCTTSIHILRRIDSQKILMFVSLHDPSVALNYPDLRVEQLMEEMWIVTAKGDRFGGADAVRYLTTRLPLLYPIAPLMHIPGTMPLWRSIYKWIARSRYKIAGKRCENGSCSLHHR